MTPGAERAAEPEQSYTDWAQQLLSAAPPGARPDVDAYLGPLTVDEAALRGNERGRRLREVRR